MLSARALPRALAGLSGSPFEGTLCRALHPGVLYGFTKLPGYTPRPLYGLGPPTSGARFTPKRGAPALYLAEDYPTALHEALQVGRSAGLKPVSGTGALVVYTVEVSLSRVLDLTQLGVQHALGTTPRELASAWRFRKAGTKPPTHVLGAAIAKSGRFDGVRFQSTKGTGACFVILVERVKAPAFVRVYDPESNLLEELP